MKLKSFFKENDTINRTKLQPTDWENIFIKPTSDRELKYKIHKALKKLDAYNPNNPIEN
jgi:hypothetical protein